MTETHKKLEELSVQTKALEVVKLENANIMWKRVQQNLPAEQLFLLRAGTDTLPTPLNLRGYLKMLFVGPTIHHILIAQRPSSRVDITGGVTVPYRTW